MNYHESVGIIQYLKPENTIAIIIVLGLQILFLAWAVGLLAFGRWLTLLRKQIFAAREVYSLYDAIVNRFASKQVENNKLDSNPYKIFDEFCSSRNLALRTPLYFHLQNIFLAGWNESRFDTDQLLQHSTKEIFRWNNLFRSILAIFIVMGLLGTLFGLADSLAQISPAVSAAAAQKTNEGLTIALGTLLNQLKSAFAPSIWGVGLTIIGIIIYSLFVQYFCIPARTALEQATIMEWVPKLYPTTPQKIIATLIKSGEVMQESMLAARQVGELANQIKDETSEFNENLAEANKVIKSLSSAVTRVDESAIVIKDVIAQRLGEFSIQFSDNVNRLTTFQSEIKKLYSYLLKDSQVFQQNVQKVLNPLNENLVKFLKEGTQIYTELNAKSQKMLNELSDKIVERMGGIDYELKANLGKLVNSMDNSMSNLTKSMSDTTFKLASSYENFAKYLEKIMGDLQFQFKQQNDQNAAQLSSVKQLNDQIISLLGQLNITLSDQNKKDEPLNNIINKLASKIDLFSSSIGDFNKHIEKIKDATEAISKTANKLHQRNRYKTKKLTIEPTDNRFLNFFNRLIRRVKSLPENSISNLDNVKVVGIKSRKIAKKKTSDNY